MSINIVIQNAGTKISQFNGMLHIQHKDGENKLPLHKINSLQIHKSCLLSSDALLLALEHGIDVLFVGRKGEVLGRVWNNRFGSISNIRKNQLIFSEVKAGMEWIKMLLVKKIQHQSALLITLSRYDRSTDDAIESAIAYLEKYSIKFRESDAASISEIADTWRGWEGNCSKKYFACINMHLPDMYRFEKRSQHPAQDIYNALLNYAYGMLYGKVEGALIKAGLDPFIGVMHRNEYNKPVLAYDVIEVFRHWADYVVTNLCMQQVFFTDMFDVEGDAWWLNTEGKRILIQGMTDYFEEVVELDGSERSRETHISLLCQQLAQQLKNFAEGKTSGNLIA
ncbi:CRISPR-associated endonuclease Cas1 [Parafilimonas sp.]|uniref:CRISPR-associated endonuclease Cas1 n=1 Tax=Parafilimonas sp. TaxID=1969739 RepID=UPI0039E4DE4F